MRRENPSRGSEHSSISLSLVCVFAISVCHNQKAHDRFSSPYQVTDSVLGAPGTIFGELKKKYFYHFILYNFIDFVTDMADWDLDYTG